MDPFDQDPFSHGPPEMGGFKRLLVALVIITIGCIAIATAVRFLPT